MRLFLLLSLVSLVAGGTKRSFDEMESPESEETLSVNYLGEILDTLSSGSGSKLAALRSMGLDNHILEQIWYYGRLEIAAFELLSEHLSADVPQIQRILNAEIDRSQTLLNRPFCSIRVSLWKTFLISSNPEIVEHFRTYTKIRTTAGGVGFFEVSDILWEKVILRKLWNATTSHRRGRADLRIIQSPRPIEQFKSLLPPKARGFVHQILHKRDSRIIKTFIVESEMLFNSRSILLDRMRDYLLTLLSFGLIDLEALSVMRTTKNRTDVPDLIRAINERFNETHTPALDLLYSEQRLSVWLKLPSLSEHFLRKTVGLKSNRGTRFLSTEAFTKLILNPLTISGIHANITMDELLLEWEDYERLEAAGGDIPISISTGIRSHKFDPNFNFANFTIQVIFAESHDARLTPKRWRVLLEFLYSAEPDVLQRTIPETTIQNLASQHSLNATWIEQKLRFLISSRYLSLDIAKELARVNRLRISTDTDLIIRDATKREPGLSTNRKRVGLFYSMMQDAMRANPNEPPFESITVPSAGAFARIDISIWKQSYILRLLTTLPN